MVVTQCEIPPETIEHVVALDAALSRLALLAVNETGAEFLTGRRVTSHREVQEAAGALLAKGPRTVVLTLGARGAYVGAEGVRSLVPGFGARGRPLRECRGGSLGDPAGCPALGAAAQRLRDAPLPWLTCPVSGGTWIRGRAVTRLFSLGVAPELVRALHSRRGWRARMTHAAARMVLVGVVVLSAAAAGAAGPAPGLPPTLRVLVAADEMPEIFIALARRE